MGCSLALAGPYPTIRILGLRPVGKVLEATCVKISLSASRYVQPPSDMLSGSCRVEGATRRFWMRGKHGGDRSSGPARCDSVLRRGDRGRLSVPRSVARRATVLDCAEQQPRPAPPAATGSLRADGRSRVGSLGSRGHLAISLRSRRKRQAETKAVAVSSRIRRTPCLPRAGRLHHPRPRRTWSAGARG